MGKSNSSGTDTIVYRIFMWVFGIYSAFLTGALGYLNSDIKALENKISIAEVKLSQRGPRILRNEIDLVDLEKRIRELEKGGQ